MLEKVKDFQYHGVRVRLYQGLEPILIENQRKLIFERRVLLNSREVHDLERNGPVEDWAQQIRTELDTHFGDFVKRKATHH